MAYEAFGRHCGGLSSFRQSPSAGCHTAAALRHLDNHSALDSVVVMIIDLVSLCISIPSPLTSATLGRLIFATSGSYRNEPVSSLDSGLSPVLTGPIDNDQDQEPHSGTNSSKRNQAASACSPCRSSKLKCSGRHPTCARCNTRGLECVWVVGKEGMTQRQALKFELDQQQRDLGNALNVLDILRNGSDQEAAETLVRLRLGQTVEQASEGSASARARRQAHDATSDTPSVAGASQKSGTECQRHDSHFAGGSTSVSEPAGSPNMLRTSRPATTEGLRPSHAEREEQSSQTSEIDTRPASWSFPNTPETHLSSGDWNNSAQQVEQSNFLMDGIFAQYDFDGGGYDGDALTMWNSHGIFDH